MTYSAATAVIEMAKSLTATAIEYAEVFWADAYWFEMGYGNPDFASFDYEFEVHMPKMNWRCKYLKEAIVEIQWEQWSNLNPTMRDWQNDEIPF